MYFDFYCPPNDPRNYDTDGNYTGGNSDGDFFGKRRAPEGESEGQDEGQSPTKTQITGDPDYAGYPLAHGCHLFILTMSALGVGLNITLLARHPVRRLMLLVLSQLCKPLKVAPSLVVGNSQPVKVKHKSAIPLFNSSRECK